MTLTRLALGNPVATLVAVLLVTMFGLISLNRLPVQLTPEVETPEISITTTWRAAAPEEVEAEIVERQEEVLRGLPGMTEMVSQAQPGQGVITVKFTIGTDMRRALLEVLNRLNRVSRYPEDADEPVLSSVGGGSSPIAWFIIKAEPGNERDIAGYQDFIEEVVQTRFERVSGVALSEVRGGRDTEIRVTFDAYKAASLGVELPVAARLAGANKDTSGGFADVGKRRYTVRFAGAFSGNELGDMVISWRDGKPVHLRDVATIERRLVDRTSFVITKGTPSMAVNAHREIGVNVIDVMEGLYAAVAELRDGPLKRAGLSIEQVYDETDYIDSSIEMLISNLAMGILLAISVLWWFLRKLRATMMVAASIPLCLLAAFSVLDATASTLNVISLAGLAFAVGMVLDASIVVLENIVRLRENGETPERAALQGPTQVWGALLASTATTVAIFLPVVFLEDEAGQLFGDLALTITSAVVASLFVAITVVPTAAQRFFSGMELTDRHKNWWDNITSKIMGLTDTSMHRFVWIAVLVTIPLTITFGLSYVIKADYLPEGNRNLAFAFVLPPPGVNIDNIEKEMGDVIAERLRPYVDGEKSPHIKHYFFVAFPQGVFLGARAVDPADINKLTGTLNYAVSGFPDTFGVAQKVSLFQGFGEGRTIDVNVQGRDLESVVSAALTGFVVIQQVLPGSQVRPLPGLQLAEPELRLVPDERRIKEAGWNREVMAQVIRALGQGLFVGDYFDGERSLDIITRVQKWETPEDLESIPLATPDAGVLPVSELVKVVRTAGPKEIRRLDRRRTITLLVTPPEGMSLEEAIDTIKEKAEPVISGMLPVDGEVRYSGTADKLQEALSSMGETFLLAIAILYLLMSALFRSFVDSLLVILALPLATFGSFLALWVLNIGPFFQPRDLLTMIGFIILLGLVVNNAILLVYQTRSAEREGMARKLAVAQAVRLRLRPILMSTLTSIFGMLPLLLSWGAGTELYRGLAGVIVGGMLVSTVFTLLLLPSLLRLGEEPEPVRQTASV